MEEVEIESRKEEKIISFGNWLKSSRRGIVDVNISSPQSYPQQCIATDKGGVVPKQFGLDF